MTARLEDLVALLKSNPSVWSLANDMPQFTQGLADVAARLQALEKAVKVLQHPPEVKP